jgi:hypothetical protein
VFLDLRIVKELRVDFSDLRILQGLRLKGRLGVGRQRQRGVRQTFELVFEVTRRRVAYW